MALQGLRYRDVACRSAVSLYGKGECADQFVNWNKPIEPNLDPKLMYKEY